MGLNLASSELHFPRFLKREGDFNFRVLKDVLEKPKNELTMKDFERCVDFNLPNHVVKVSMTTETTSDPVKEDPKPNQDSQLQSSQANDLISVQEVYEQPKQRTFLVSKMEARTALLEKKILLYGDAKTQKPQQEEFIINKDVDPEEIFANLFLQMEMGRQWILDGRNKERQMKENKKKTIKVPVKKNGNEEDVDSKKVEAAIYVQKFIRGYRARKKTKDFRRKKMQFLGLSIFNEHQPKEKDKVKFEIRKKVGGIEEKRRRGIQKKLQEMMDQRGIIKEELKENEGPEMMDKMLQERREFILGFFEMHEGKQLPKSEKTFYERFELKDIKNLEENAKKKKKKSKGFIFHILDL